MSTVVLSMSSGSVKRQIKRPLGTRVSAPWPDGIYYPGIVRPINRSSLKSKLDSNIYTVIFDDGYCKDYTSDQIVGPNFQNSSGVHLKFNQRVFVTHNGRECTGHVQKHKKQTNEVFIKLEDVSETMIQRKLDEVRLLAERQKKGKMTIEGGDHYHQRMSNASSCQDVKRKATNNIIEVPSAKSPKVEDEPLMDDVMAAMVLTSLSASPLGGGIRSRHNSNESNASTVSDFQLPMSPKSPLSRLDSFSPSSSGHFSWDIHSRGTPSPVSSSTSDVDSPMVHSGTMIFGPPSVDEGIDVSDPRALCIAENKTPITNTMATIKTLYKCTWPGCGKTLCTVQGIERHIRTLHLSRKENGLFGDHEEEFYYTEIETTVDTVSDTFANMYTSPASPSPITHTLVEDPYFFKDEPTSPVKLNEGAVHDRLTPSVELVQRVCQNTQPQQNTQQQYTVVTPVLVSPSHQQQASFSWPTVPTTQFTRFQATPQTIPLSPPTPSHHHPIIRHHKQPSIVEQRHQQHQAQSPKTSQHFVIPPKTTAAVGSHLANGSPVHATTNKIRSEGKKCRKVYGMDNRDMWCTQCRWKKACVRFT